MKQMWGGPPEDACPQSVHWSTRAAIGSLSFRKGKGRRGVEVVQCRVPGMVWGAGLLPLCAHSQPMLRPSPCRGKFFVVLQRTL